MSQHSRTSYTKNSIDLQTPLPVKVLEQSTTDSRDWEYREADINEIITDPRIQNIPTFVFANSDVLRRGAPDLRARLEGYYGMPTDIWSDTQWESNGFFGCAGDERVRHKTWFRFLIKMVVQKRNKETGYIETTAFGNPQYDYYWHKMGFFSTWSPNGHQSILCLDCPPEFVGHIRKSLSSVGGESFHIDPYCFHPFIVGGVVSTFDTSIWALRDLVRMTEKNRKRDEKMADYEDHFDYLHEISRHVNHSGETLTVATEVMSKMVHRHGTLLARAESAPDSHRDAIMQVDDNLDFYQGLLFGFKCRCESMQQRHQSEISLAQSRAVASDAAAMKAIAGLTIVFLPATFVSAIFSMSFFESGAEWGLSPKMWIYWVIAIPVTLITVLLLRKGPKGSIMRFFTF
ncbi:hypothetical protein TWF225_006238 [Orbilia oligospora]|nr:hypothetical protein TWF225_006238 [Orbilia oligospora]KAF3244178.1 hypothetical protein TWF217_010846 [Orbilia oligospora]KAF3262710.1 hypothetical protein TWF128_002459 [Orbilia oligospora]